MSALMIAIAGGLLLSPVALAKKDKGAEVAQGVAPGVIEPTGIAAFDEVFAELAGIHEALDRAELQLAAADKHIAAAAGLPEGSPTAEALRQLAAEAGGGVEVIMSGSTPTLRATEVVPEDTAAAIEAINRAVLDVAGAAAEVSELPERCAALLDRIGTFRAQLSPALLQEAGIEATDLPQVSRRVRDNARLAADTPARIAAVAEELAVFMDAIKDFGAEVSGE